MKRLKAEVFNEVDPVELEHIHLGPELHRLYFLPSDNGPHIAL